MPKLMMISLCLLLNVLNGFTAIQQQHLMVYFETDKDELTAQSKSVLNKFIRELKTTDYQITVQGHTDARGGNDYNQKLSKRRAENVHKFLVEKEIDLSQLELLYQGERNPIKPNTNASNMSKNRRVEVTVTRYSFDDITEFEQALKGNHVQKFNVQPNNAIVIEGEQGIKILIEQSTFLYADGSPVAEEITLGLTEALNFEDYISHSLMTISDKEQLESGGMFRLSAQTATGEEVFIDKYNPLTVVVPSEDRQNDMQIFTSKTGSDWKTTGSNIDNELRLIIRRKPYVRPKMRALPQYRVDISSKPKTPEKPRAPRFPREPRVENYQPNISLIQTFSKKKIEARSQQRYEMAVTNYKTRVKRYDRREEQFLVRIDAYDSLLDVHEASLNTWYDKIDQEKENFKTSPRFMAAVKANDELYEKYKDINKEQMATWKKERDARMAELSTKAERLGITTTKFMSNYVFTINKLDWINVDRFYDLKENETQQITVRDMDETEEKVFIVFKDMNSMLPLYNNQGSYVQSRFPKGAAAAVLAYKVIDGRPWLYYQDIEDGGDFTLEFKPCKFREIQEIFANIQS